MENKEDKIELKRKIYDELVKWNNDPNKVPLVVDGLRQIGKSHIVEKFAKDIYGEENVIPYDFRNLNGNPRLFNCRDESVNKYNEYTLYHCFLCIANEYN